MAEMLKGPVVGPTGVRYPKGHEVPTAEPDWFIADLRKAGQIVDRPAEHPVKKAAAKKAPAKKAPAKKAAPRKAAG